MKALGGLLAIFLFTVVIVGGFGLLIWWGIQTEKKRVAVWRALASRLGATFVEPHGGFFTRRACSMFLEQGGALAWLDTYVVSHGKTSTSYTRCRADFVLGIGPVFRVYREGVFSSLGKALGTQDVTLGIDPAFDEHFMVKCDDPGSLPTSLTPAVQHRMRVTHSQSWLQSDGKTLTLTWLGLERNPDKLEAALLLVLEAARWETRWLDIVAAVPNARAVPAAGAFGARQPPCFVFDVGGAPVRVFPALHNLRPVLRVHAPTMRAGNVSVRVSAPAGRLDPASLPPGMVPAGALDELSSLGDTQLGAEPGEVWGDLLGPSSPDRVERMTRVISAVATGAHTVPFR